MGHVQAKVPLIAGRALEAKQAVRRALFERAGYRPYPGQAKIHDSLVRHRVALCGRRFGKCMVGGTELVVESELPKMSQYHLFPAPVGW